MQDQVMQKAQELADAIKASGTYLEMKRLEDELLEDEEAAEAVNNLMRKRQRVEDLLSSKGMNPEELVKANQEMAQAEKDMNRRTHDYANKGVLCPSINRKGTTRNKTFNTLKRNRYKNR